MKNKKKGMFYSAYTIEKTLKSHLIEWSATALSVFGAILNAQQYIQGFYVWGVANILWMTFAWKYKHWGLFIMNLIFFGINISGLYFWGNNL